MGRVFLSIDEGGDMWIVVVYVDDIGIETGIEAFPMWVEVEPDPQRPTSRFEA